LSPQLTTARTGENSLKKRGGGSLLRMGRRKDSESGWKKSREKDWDILEETSQKVRIEKDRETVRKSRKKIGGVGGGGLGVLCWN